MPVAPQTTGAPPPLIKKEHAKQQNKSGAGSNKAIKAAEYISASAEEFSKEAEDKFLDGNYEDALKLVEQAIASGPATARNYSDLLLQACKILLSITNTRGKDRSKEGMQYARRAVDAKLKVRRALLAESAGHGRTKAKKGKRKQTQLAQRQHGRQPHDNINGEVANTISIFARYLKDWAIDRTKEVHIHPYDLHVYADQAIAIAPKERASLVAKARAFQYEERILMQRGNILCLDRLNCYSQVFDFGDGSVENSGLGLDELFEYNEAMYDTVRLFEDPDTYELQSIRARKIKVALLDINQDNMAKWWKCEVLEDLCLGDIVQEINYLSTHIMRRLEAKLAKASFLDTFDLRYLQKTYYFFGYTQKLIGNLPGAVSLWRKMYKLKVSHWNWYYMRLDKWCDRMEWLAKRCAKVDSYDKIPLELQGPTCANEWRKRLGTGLVPGEPGGNGEEQENGKGRRRRRGQKITGADPSIAIDDPQAIRCWHNLRGNPRRRPFYGKSKDKESCHAFLVL